MKAARGITVVVLLFLGLSSCAGGVPLLIDPSGGILKMPLSLLDHSPFHSFLIPGLILLLFNGILSMVIAVAVMRKTRKAGMWVGIQGCVLFGWITIEVMMIRAIAWPHFVYWGVALVLIACGWVLRHQERSAPSADMASSRK